MDSKETDEIVLGQLIDLVRYLFKIKVLDSHSQKYSAFLLWTRKNYVGK